MTRAHTRMATVAVCVAGAFAGVIASRALRPGHTQDDAKAVAVDTTSAARRPTVAVRSLVRTGSDVVEARRRPDTRWHRLSPTSTESVVPPALLTEWEWTKLREGGPAMWTELVLVETLERAFDADAADLANCLAEHLGRGDTLHTEVGAVVEASGTSLVVQSLAPDPHLAAPVLVCFDQHARGPWSAPDDLHDQPFIPYAGTIPLRFAVLAGDGSLYLQLGSRQWVYETDSGVLRLVAP